MGRQTQSSLERLIANLSKLSSHDRTVDFLVPFEDGLFLTIDNIDEVTPPDFQQLVREILEDLPEWLVSDSGHNHTPNREILQRLGYSFDKGTEDKLGLVEGIINVSNFKIAYEPK